MEAALDDNIDDNTGEPNVDPKERHSK